MRNLALFGVVLLTWCVAILHRGVAIPPVIPSASTPARESRWISKHEMGINQLLLFGSAYQRGLASGSLTQGLLYQQEREMNRLFSQFFPNPIVRVGFNLALMRWYWGIEDYFDPWMLEELYGVSQSASHDFDFLADRFTRQIAYHGLHEVGQWMIDNAQPFGCTVFAVPFQNSWVIGRNFDFNAGRVFDEEKVMKWVFPTEGFAFVSVIWSGMVGVVTGVNENGVYISINAAGTKDFSRYGTPSTLVILKALQFSRTAMEAKSVIESAQMFITDIFVVADSTGQFFRIEKSPKRVHSIPVTHATVITNHLTHEDFATDSVNRSRMERGTTLERSVSTLR